MTLRYNISYIWSVSGYTSGLYCLAYYCFCVDLSFIIDMLISFGSFIASYFPTQRLTSRKYLNEIGLSRRDYRYVQSQLHHAHTKIRNILKSFINIRSIKDFRQVNDIYRISRSIHTSIKQRPAMFLKLKAFSILIWIMHLT